MSMRRDHPEMWAELVAAAREIIGDDWTEDQIAAVMNKVRAPSPDVLLDHIEAVLVWCAAALRSGDDENVAIVEIWQMPRMPVRITVGDDGRISHELDVERERA